MFVVILVPYIYRVIDLHRGLTDDLFCVHLSYAPFPSYSFSPLLSPPTPFVGVVGKWHDRASCISIWKIWCVYGRMDGNDIHRYLLCCRWSSCRTDYWPFECMVICCVLESVCVFLCDFDPLNPINPPKTLNVISICSQCPIVSQPSYRRSIHRCALTQHSEFIAFHSQMWKPAPMWSNISVFWVKVQLVGPNLECVVSALSCMIEWRVEPMHLFPCYLFPATSIILFPVLKMFLRSCVRLSSTRGIALAHRPRRVSFQEFVLFCVSNINWYFRDKVSLMVILDLGCLCICYWTWNPISQRCCESIDEW